MGFAFQLGAPEAIYMEAFAAAVRVRLLQEWPEAGAWLDSGYECSPEIPTQAWTELQAAAEKDLGEEGCPNLTAVAPWNGVYLPIPCPADILAIPTGKRRLLFARTEALEVASLSGLVEELVAFGRGREWESDDLALRAAIERWEQDVDEEPDLVRAGWSMGLLFARMALARGAVLWIVK